MKDLFPQFDPVAERDYEKIWKEALFVFDANVLLNLYRYQTNTREQLLDAIGKLSDRIWIPHHVALEFQRNRFNVIADQNKRFTQVRKAIDAANNTLRKELDTLQLNRRHSLINPDPLISGFEKLVQEFLSDLDNIQKEQQKISALDPLKAKIEALFDGRVGNPPASQDEVEKIYKTAGERYSLEIPPGYLDGKKDKDGPDEHVHGGIVYKRKYGDYLIWRQLLDYIGENSIDSVVFVTDDAKSDWWWIVESDGPKTLGPRPELVDEALSKGSLSSFMMYNPERFLSYAKSFVAADVSTETLEEVRDISMVRSEKWATNFDIRMRYEIAERSVFDWLSRKYESVVQNKFGFPDFVIVNEENKKIGFEVKVITSVNMVLNRARDIFFRAHYLINEGEFDEISIIWVADDMSVADEMAEKFFNSRHFKISDSGGVGVIVGLLIETEAKFPEFEPLLDFSLKIESNVSRVLKR